MATLVFRYGLLKPTKNAKLAYKHLRAAHKYRNLLIEVARGQRAAIRLSESRFPQLVGLEAAIRMLDADCLRLATAAKAARSAGRTRSIPADLRTQLKQARELLARARFCRRVYRCWVVLPLLQLERDRINSMATDLRRNIRQNRRALTGELLYHGTYSAAADAVSASCSDTPLWTSKGAPNDPDFRRWTGSGTLGVQIQGGTCWDRVSLDHTQLQVGPRTSVPRRCRPGHPGTHRRCIAERCTRAERDPDRRRGRGYGGRGARQAVTLRLRQESDERRPVWVEWPMQLARPLPDGAKIMNAAVHCRVVAGDLGPREQWYCTMTLRLDDRPRRNDGIAVSVDVGWRPLPDGSMRVAYWRGEDGRHDQLVLTPWQLSGLSKGDSIRSIRDRAINALRSGLISWIDALPQADRPPWLIEARRRMPGWEAPWRFARLIKQWQCDDGFTAVVSDGRPTALCVLAWLQAWSRRDQHLAGYEHGARAGSLRQRRDHYRRFAAWLSESYDVVVIERFDKRSFSRKPATEDGAETEGVELRYKKRIACTSELCEALTSRFGQRGEAVQVSAVNTTQDCAEHGCHAKLAGDAADGITQQCETGHVWDQDDNACRNLLTRYRERSGDEKPPGTARSGKDAKSETRRQRARRMRQEREDRLATARQDAAE